MWKTDYGSIESHSQERCSIRPLGTSSAPFGILSHCRNSELGSISLTIKIRVPAMGMLTQRVEGMFSCVRKKKKATGKILQPRLGAFQDLLCCFLAEARQLQETNFQLKKQRLMSSG